MTKLCERGKKAAKAKFKVYPSAYANAYASKICAGKIKDPSGVKRKDFKGPKPASAKEGMMTEIEKERQKRQYTKKIEGVTGRQSELDKILARRLKANEAEVRREQQRQSRLSTIGKGASNMGSEKLRRRGLNTSDVEKLMDAMPKYNVGGHSVMGSPVSVDVDGDTLSNPSASAYYKDLLK